MASHRQHQNIFGQGHIIIINLPHDGMWPFHQTGDFIQQSIIRQQCQPSGFGQIIQLSGDSGAAGAAISHDKMRSHLLIIAGGNMIILALINGLQVNVFWCKEAVAMADMTISNASPATQIINPCHRFAIQQNINPVQWPHPAHLASAPTLAFRPRKIGNHAIDHIWQNIHCLLTRLMDHGKIELAFRRIALFQLITRHSNRA